MSRTRHHRQYRGKSWFDYYVVDHFRRRKLARVEEASPDRVVGGEDDWPSCELRWFGALL